MAESLGTTALSTRESVGEEPATNTGVEPRREADARPPTKRLIGLPRLTALGREHLGPVVTYHRLWTACADGRIPACKVGGSWVMDEAEALAALPQLFDRPAASDAA